MSRAPGYDKSTIARREAWELRQFNGRLMRDDCQLLRLLLSQELRRRESPSDGLVNAAEIAERIEKYLSEMIALTPAPLPRGEGGAEGVTDET